MPSYIKVLAIKTQVSLLYICQLSPIAFLTRNSSFTHLSLLLLHDDLVPFLLMRVCDRRHLSEGAWKSSKREPAIASFFFSLSLGSRSAHLYNSLRVAVRGHPDTWSVTLITHSQKRHTPAREQSAHTYIWWGWSLSGDKLHAAAFCACAVGRGHATQVRTRAFCADKS